MPVPKNDKNILKNSNDQKFSNDKIELNETIRKSKIFYSISNITHMSIQQDLIKFHHQCSFSSPRLIWITTINNHHFTGWPGLTATAIQQHLLILTETFFKHSKLLQKNKLSTTKPTTKGKSLKCKLTPIQGVISQT